MFSFRIMFSQIRQFLHFRKGIYKLKKDIVSNIIAIGLSPFLMNLCSSLVITLINRGLKDYGGDMAIGAYGIVNRIAFLFVMIIMGLNQGMQPIAGYNFGARQFDRVKEVLKLTITYAVGIASFGFLICQFFPSVLVRMFTTDQELIDASIFGLRVVFVMFPFVGLQMVIVNYFQSIGEAKKAIFLSLTRQMLFLVPCLIILPSFLGTLGIWVSLPIADFISVIVACIVLRRQFKNNIVF